MKKIKQFFKTLGPGFITGAADDDPAGIATYSQTGALFGFAQLWTVLLSLPLMIAVQEMCGRIGMVTGNGLAGITRKYYSKKLLYGAIALLFVANTINIGADLGAMAAALQLIIPLPFIFWLIVVVLVTLLLQIFVPYPKYASLLKYLAFVLFAYIFTSFMIHIDWPSAIRSFIIPYVRFDREYLLNIVAILGTTISPYLFFWQADQEVEEEIEHHKIQQMGVGMPRVTPKDITRLGFDTIIGMVFSQVTMFFIILATGATLFTNGIHTIDTAAEAASALRPFAGDFAFLLFTLGIVGTGLLAVPILSGSASYAISEAFHWNAGLSLKLKKAHGFYAVIVIATLVGMGTNFIGINPMQALYYSAVVNGIIAPPLLILIMVIANNKKVMGERVNGKVLNVLGVITIIIMSMAGIGLIVAEFIK